VEDNLIKAIVYLYTEEFPRDLENMSHLL